MQTAAKSHNSGPPISPQSSGRLKSLRFGSGWYLAFVRNYTSPKKIEDCFQYLLMMFPTFISRFPSFLSILACPYYCILGLHDGHRLIKHGGPWGNPRTHQRFILCGKNHRLNDGELSVMFEYPRVFTDTVFFGPVYGCQ